MLFHAGAGRLLETLGYFRSSAMDSFFDVVLSECLRFERPSTAVEIGFSHTDFIWICFLVKFVSYAFVFLVLPTFNSAAYFR